MNRILKALLFSLTFIASINTARGQTYKQMLAQFNEWHVTDCFFGCLTDVYFTDADTVVNGYDYSILDGFHYINRNFLLREDTIEKQVFLLATGIGKEDFEYLLYDFSLLPGDSMPIYNPISPLPDSAGYFIVDSIVLDVLIDGDTYKHFYLSALDSAKSVTGRAEWIEGIGSLNLVNTPGAYGDINNGGALSCFFNNQTLHYSNLDSIIGCVQVHPNLSSGPEVSSNQKFNIFPNPASSVLYFNSWNSELSMIVIFDMLGRELLSYSLTQVSNYQIDISVLPKGSFLVQFLDENGIKTVKKLVIE